MESSIIHYKLYQLKDFGALCDKHKHYFGNLVFGLFFVWPTNKLTENYTHCSVYWVYIFHSIPYLKIPYIYVLSHPILPEWSTMTCWHIVFHYQSVGWLNDVQMSSNLFFLRTTSIRFFQVEVWDKHEILSSLPISVTVIMSLSSPLYVVTWYIYPDSFQKNFKNDLQAIGKFFMVATCVTAKKNVILYYLYTHSKKNDGHAEKKLQNKNTPIIIRCYNSQDRYGTRQYY